MCQYGSSNIYHFRAKRYNDAVPISFLDSSVRQNTINGNRAVDLAEVYEFVLGLRHI